VFLLHETANPHLKLKRPLDLSKIVLI